MLISRLLVEHAGIFALREPALLRAIAARVTPSTPAARTPGLDVALALLGRTWRREQRAVVKVTSFVSELAERMLAAEHPRAPAR